MATFRPVNTPMAIEVQTNETMAASPTTPTPTQSTYSQRPLPNSPFPQAVQIPERIDEATSPREGSQNSRRKSRGNSEDIDMDDSDPEGHGDDGGSDDESINADGTRSNKKKKSQRFYCTEYPPCKLSFTRSEHLARHIRKHTGERPFQCHCSRRFSRLDNLRQHAQTVHVNEEIPMDSLAATGTRFQRQIRTDRVRAPARARSSTANGIGVPARGHGKSLSTSNIGPIGSSYSNREDVRRRPPPLIMADGRPRLSMEPYPGTNEPLYSHRPHSPNDFSTPTSATFSTGQHSPRWGSAIASPTSSHSRAHSMYAGSRTPGRRLSVPSSGNPFHSPHTAALGRPLFGAGPINTSNPAPFSPASSVTASPTSSVFSRRDSVSTADEAWRRRTWHPDSNNFQNANSNSRLSSVVTPTQYQTHSNSGFPLANPAQQPQTSSLRLPGIESFDEFTRRPASPPKRNPSPMIVDGDVAHPSALLPVTESGADDRRGTAAKWDMGLHRGLTRLGITHGTTPPRDGASHWSQDVNQALEAEADRARLNAPTVRFNETVVVNNAPPTHHNPPSRGFHQHTMSAPALPPSRDMRRHGWYHGPPPTHVEGSPPERAARVERMIHPNISEFAGFPARAEPAPEAAPPQRDNPQGRDNMLRLQALVAVATGEGSAATTAY